MRLSVFICKIYIKKSMFLLSTTHHSSYYLMVPIQCFEDLPLFVSPCILLTHLCNLITMPYSKPVDTPNSMVYLHKRSAMHRTPCTTIEEWQPLFAGSPSSILAFNLMISFYLSFLKYIFSLVICSYDTTKCNRIKFGFI